MAETRFCTSCRAEISSDVCPQCGVYAGDLFDGRLPRRRRRRRGRWIAAFVLILALTAAAGWTLLQRRGLTELTEPAPVAVVSDRPGGSRAEAEAIRSLRRHLLSTGIRGECIVISSQGLREGNYHLTAIDRCAETRLGRWVVDAKSGRIQR